MALDTNKQYSPNDLAKYVGSANDAWNGKEFFVDGEKYKIIDNGNGSRRVQKLNPTAGDIKSGQAFGGNTKQILVNEISKQLIELEDRLGQIPNVTFTTEELDAFMNKAIAEITPYYDKKKEEIEKGIKEGKIQTAEDTLALIERVKMDVQNNFAKYDIDQAQTEEEFINRLADITASSNEATDTKRFEWKQRLQDARIGQVQKNIFTSGVGQKQITDLETRKQQELKAIERQTGQALTETNTTKKFSLDRIALARQAITDERKEGLENQRRQMLLRLKHVLISVLQQTNRSEVKLILHITGHSVILRYTIQQLSALLKKREELLLRRQILILNKMKKTLEIQNMRLKGRRFLLSNHENN